jgi:hypothetical protein
MKNRKGVILLFSILVLLFGMQCNVLNLRSKLPRNNLPVPANPQPAPLWKSWVPVQAAPPAS